MNIIKTISQYTIDNVFFGDHQINTVILDSNFMRLLYSGEYFTLNGIFILLEFKNIIVEKYFNKYKCSFNIQENSHVIHCLQKIELGILKKLSLQWMNRLIQPSVVDKKIAKMEIVVLPMTCGNH